MKSQLGGELVAIFILIIVIAVCSVFMCGCKQTPAPAPDVEFRVEITAFTAKWCGPCKKVRPILIAIRVRGIIVDILDIDSRFGKRRAKELGVTSVPTFFVRTKSGTTRTQDINVVLRIIKENSK